MTESNWSRRDFLVHSRAIALGTLGASLYFVPCHAEAQWPVYRLPPEFYNAWHGDSYTQYQRDIHDAQRTMAFLRDPVLWAEVENTTFSSLMQRYGWQVHPDDLRVQAYLIARSLYEKALADFDGPRYTGYTPYLHYFRFNPRTYNFELSWRYQQRECTCVKDDYTFSFLPVFSDRVPVTLTTNSGSAQAFWFFSHIYLHGQQRGGLRPVAHNPLSQANVLPGTRLRLAGVLQMPGGGRVLHSETIRLRTDNVYDTYVTAQNSSNGAEARGIVMEVA